MANITRFDPFGSLKRFDPFGGMDEMFKDMWVRPWQNNGLEFNPQIRMDVSEDDKAYTVKADVPGVNKEDVHVEIDGNKVSITAEVRKEKEEKKGGMTLRSERYYGKQYRSFTLSHDIDESKAEAKYNNGVLELTLPKKAGAASKQLKVQ
jgi:HSP20 family protein